ncbi:hypothetical protein [Serratia symbiotica]|uniref:hypothetical protein n=1 Tax=Serratia symbiotica TaxID=138074 RepID=UPI0030D35407
MYALPERCLFRGLFIPNPIYSTKPLYVHATLVDNGLLILMSFRVSFHSEFSLQ